MSKKLEWLFRGKHRVEAADARGLEADDLRELHAMATGETASPDRLRALAILAKAERADAVDVFAHVLGNPREDAAVRIAAAFWLGQGGDRGAEAVLLEQLANADDDLLRTKLMAALAKVGSQRAIGAIEEASRRTDAAFVQQQAAFARAVVAHREGLGANAFAPPAGARVLEPVGRGIEMAVHAASEEDVHAAVRDVGTSPYGIVASPALAFDLKCGSSRYMILANAAHFEEGLDAAVRAPIVLALVLLQSPEDGGWSVSRIVLAGAREREAFDVGVYRTDGLLVHAGRGTVDGSSVAIELRSLDVPGNAALFVSAQVAGRAVRFASVVGEGVGRKKQFPSRGEAPAPGRGA